MLRLLDRILINIRMLLGNNVTIFVFYFFNILIIED